MSWLDKFKEYFNYKPEKKLGPKELPRDIVEDLLRKKHHGTIEQEWYKHNNQNNHAKSPESVFGEMQKMFCEMDMMFKDFFSDTPKFSIEFIEPKDIPETDNLKEKTLREKMLDGKEDNDLTRTPFHNEEKFSLFQSHPSFMFRGFFGFPFGNENNFEKTDDGQELDRDLDDRVKNGTSLDDIINNTLSDDQHSERKNQSLLPFDFYNSEKFFPEHNHVTSAYKYSTVKKKINPDGSIETQSSKRDSDGNEQVVVTRSIGDQTHEITTKKNCKGVEEKTENLINMDPDDLPKFEENWNKKTPTRRSDILVPPNMQVFPGNEDNFFSSWWKPKL